MKLFRASLALGLALVFGPALAQNNPGTQPLSIAKGGTAAATAPLAWANLVQPPSAGALGGIKSLTCSASNWFNTLSTSGALGCSQPNFTDLAGSIAIGQIPASLITYAKIQNVTASRLLGNPTGGAAAPSEISLGATLGFSGTALQTNALTGDITTSANSFATTIAANAVTNAKMATMAANTVKGNATGGSAVPTDVAPAAARSSSLLNVDSFTGHGDSIYTILATDRTVGTNAAFTASRTWTLPAANAVNPGQEIIVADFQGTVTATNTLVISRAGADTVNGGTTVTISAANGAYLFKSDGTSKWTAQALGAATGGGVTSVTCNAGLSGGAITTSGTCAIDATFFQNYLTGLILSNDGGSPNTVLDIAAGSAMDSTNASFIKIGAFTKSTAGAWTSGTGNNGMGNGLTIAINTWYHVCLTPNGGTADVYFDTSASCANKPAGVSGTFFRRIGSFKTNGSSQIIAFTQVGDEFHWAANAVDVSFSAIGSTTATASTLSVPLGVQVNALFHVGASLTSNGILITSFDENDIAPESIGGSANVSISNGSTLAFLSGDFNKRTNTSAQIRWRALAATGSVGFYTYGWIDARGK